MKLSLVALISSACLSLSCAVGAPLGWSSGKSWSFPLVAPLEGNIMLVPVKINGSDPYLFMIDPDSHISSVDEGIVSEHDLFASFAPHKEADESDTRQRIRLAEIPLLQIGDSLTIHGAITARIHKAGSFWVGGRRVRGLLGRDVIADSVIFAANRDTGMATLAAQGHGPLVKDAPSITYRVVQDQKLVTATVNQASKVILHLDLGGHRSALWPAKMRQLKLPRIPIQGRVMDHYGTAQEVSFGTIIASLDVGPVAVKGMMMLPYMDKRKREVDVDGTLGQNFFSQYNLIANWHKKTIWLQARNPDLGSDARARMARWGNAFAACASPACVAISVVGSGDPIAKLNTSADSHGSIPGHGQVAPSASGPTSEPGVDTGAGLRKDNLELQIMREDLAVNRTYEILFEALDKTGKPLGMPLMKATLRSGNKVVVHKNLDSGYRNATSFRVLDLSPFVRECSKTASNEQCVWPLNTP